MTITHKYEIRDMGTGERVFVFFTPELPDDAARDHYAVSMAKDWAHINRRNINDLAVQQVHA